MKGCVRKETTPSALTEEALEELLRGSCRERSARPPVLSVNPSTSSDSKRGLWSPGVTAKPEALLESEQVGAPEKKEQPLCFSVTSTVTSTGTVEDPPKDAYGVLGDRFLKQW